MEFQVTQAGVKLPETKDDPEFLYLPGTGGGLSVTCLPSVFSVFLQDACTPCGLVRFFPPQLLLQFALADALLGTQ